MSSPDQIQNIIIIQFELHLRDKGFQHFSENEIYSILFTSNACDFQGKCEVTVGSVVWFSYYIICSSGLEWRFD